MLGYTNSSTTPKILSAIIRAFSVKLKSTLTPPTELSKTPTTGIFSSKTLSRPATSPPMSCNNYPMLQSSSAISM